MVKIWKILLLSLLLYISISFAHSGRTDKYGGHNNRKTGGYHYHNAGSVHNSNNMLSLTVNFGNI